MKTVTEHIRNHLLGQLDFENGRRPSYEELAESEWSPEFERHMRVRLIMGALRYSLLHDKSAPKWDCISSLISRAEEYRKDGNQEHLVDIANLALIEFCRPACHPNPKFVSQTCYSEQVLRGVVVDG